jgi:hypothetical protein
MLLPLLAACGGGGGGGSLPNTEVPAAAAPVSSLDEVQSDARYEAGRRGLASLASSTHLLYIGNTGNNAITVYLNSASGNTAPIYSIAGSKTLIDNPGQLSEDAQGNLYVANDSLINPAILVFAHGAHGNVAPIRRLAGNLTGLHRISGMTVDQSTGKLFVVDYFAGQNPQTYKASLLRFPPNATGDTAPFARSSEGLFLGFQLANDSTGNNIIEAHTCGYLNCNLAGVETFAKQFPNNGLTDLYGIGGFGVSGVADDPTTKTYLVSSGNGIYRLAENTNGYGPDITGTAQLTPAPVAIITSDTCGGQLAVAPGSTPATYVVQETGCPGTPNGAVDVYANSASGSAAPLRTLSGSATQLNKPYGIYEGA